MSAAPVRSFRWVTIGKPNPAVSVAEMPREVFSIKWTNPSDPQAVLAEFLEGFQWQCKDLSEIYNQLRNAEGTVGRQEIPSKDSAGTNRSTALTAAAMVERISPREASSRSIMEKV